MKTCPRCGTKKPLTDFHACVTSKDGRVSWCKKCRICNTVKRTAISLRERNYSRKYGVSVDWVDFELKRRKGLCDICGECCGDREVLSLDHNHETGKLRGFLCNNCNRGLGLLGDSLKQLRNAVKYLEKHQ